MLTADSGPLRYRRPTRSKCERLPGAATIPAATRYHREQVRFRLLCRHGPARWSRRLWSFAETRHSWNGTSCSWGSPSVQPTSPPASELAGLAMDSPRTSHHASPRIQVQKERFLSFTVQLHTAATIRGFNVFKGRMVLPDRIELSTSPLPRECSTTELRQRRKERRFTTLLHG